MLSDKKPVSKRKTKTLAYSSYFKQKVGQESRRISHGIKNKQKTSHGLTRNFTEGRISRSRSRRISHGLTRKNTEKTEAEKRKEE